MITVSLRSTPSRGYYAALNNQFGVDPSTGKSRYVMFLFPLSFDGGSSDNSYRLTAAECGTLIPAKRTKWTVEEAIPGTVYNTVRAPHGRPQHGVFHESIDGTITIDGQAYSYDQESWSLEGVTVSGYNLHDGSTRIEKLYTFWDFDLYLAVRIAEFTRRGLNRPILDSRCNFEVLGDRTRVRMIFVEDYKTYWWAKYTVQPTLIDIFDKNGVTEAYSTGGSTGTDSSVIGSFDWSDIETRHERNMRSYYYPIQPPTGDPRFRSSEGELPPKGEVINFVNGLFRQISEREDGPRTALSHLSEQWADSCLQAVNNARFVKVNMIEFWKDIGETFAEVGAYEKFIQLCADYAIDGATKLWRKLRKMSKQAANTYLATYYGTRLTMSDLEEISNGGAKYIWTYYSEHRKDARDLKGTNIVTYEFPEGSFVDSATLRTNYQLNYNPYQGISEFNEIVHELGYGLDSYQIWEAIPLSFTVDWFVNVTDWLKANDLDNYMAKLQVNYEVKSYRLTADISRYASETSGWSCELGYTIYNRLCSNTPTVHPAAITLAGEPQKHWLQGASLLVSRFA